MDQRSSALREGFVLGPWRVEPALNQLTRDGEVTRLEPKVMAVLVALAASEGRAVGRDALLDEVWRSRHVSEDLPRRAIYSLRKVLGDEPRQPTYIETIPRVGYRLLVPATTSGPTVPPPEPAAGSAPSADRAAPAWPRRARPVAVAVAVGLVGAVTLAVLAATRAPAMRGEGPRMAPLTASSGLEYDPALSPDGSRVAFVGTPDTDEGREQAVFVQRLDVASGETATARRLTHAPARFDQPIESPCWSPDGERLAYLRWEPEIGWGVWEVAADGGDARRRHLLGRAGASGLAWSPDGTRLVVGLRRDPGLPYALHLLSADPGPDEAAGSASFEPLTTPPAASVGDHLPAWSPDGTHIAFVRHDARDAAAVYVVDAEGVGMPRAVLSGRHKVADVDWSADATSLLVAVHERGRHRLWQVSVATGQVTRRDELGEDTRFVSVARQGNRLVQARTRFTFHVHRLELDDGARRRVPALSSTSHDAELAVAPDGRTLVLRSMRSGAAELWRADLDGRRPVRLTSRDGGDVGHPRWLANGETLVFHATTDGVYDLWTVDAAGGPARPIAHTPHDDRVPSPLPDGQSLVFGSNRSGRWQLWRMPIAGGPATAMTREGGYRAQPSPDGRWLYYTRWRRDGLWRVSMEGGPEMPVLGETLREWHGGNWAMTDDGIVFVEVDEGRTSLALLNPDAGTIVRRWPLDTAPVQSSLALTPEIGTAFFVQLDRLESDLMQVDDWHG